MHPAPRPVRFASRRLLAALALPVSLTFPLAQTAIAADGTWNTTTSGGLWSNAANWSSGTVADSSTAAAFFNNLDITAATTVNLDSARTIGTLVFGDTATGTAGSWVLANDSNAANILTLGGAATITVNTMASGAASTAPNVTISAVITGTNGLTKNGSGTNNPGSSTNVNGTGTLTLSGANTYTGATNINTGTIRATNASAFGGVAGAKLTTNVVNVADGARLVVSTTIANTVNLNGATALALAGGSGTLSGIVNLQSNSSAWVTNVGGNNTLTFSSSGALNLGNNVFSISGAGTANGATIAGALTGGATSGITKNGGNPLTMSGDGSGYSGTTILNAGELRVGSANALGTGTLAMNAGNDSLVTLRSTDTAERSIAAAITLTGGNANSRLLFGSTNASFNGGLTFTNTTEIALPATRKIDVHNITRFNAPFTGAGGINFNAANNGSPTITQAGGTLILNGANTYTGNTTVNAGTFQLGNGGTTGSLSTSSAISVASGATFAVNRSDRIAQGTDFRSGITGAGSFSQVGSGTTVLAGNTFTGAINASAGTLLVNGDNSAASGVNVASGARLGGLNGSVGAVTFNSGAALAYDLADASQTGGLVTASFGGAGIGSFTLYLTGAGAGFDSSQSYSWEILRSDLASISSISGASITIDTSSFAQSFEGAFTWSTDTDSLFLNYSAVPEPASYALLAGGAMLSLAFSRRRRVRV